MDKTQQTLNRVLYAGIDVGSTTTKIAALDKDGSIVFSDYRRHHARQYESVRNVLKRLYEAAGDAHIYAVMTGSGSKPIAETLGLHFVQEVVANSIAIQKDHPGVKTAIELGGQDAKIIFFRENEQGRAAVSEMRMNGSCAGGTGAFIDEVAAILKLVPEEFDSFAARGVTPRDISGRCGVFAKTDIQPLLNQGVSREDLALSAFHAIAKQTIGGLAQGLEIKGPVIFEGGPLTFNKTLVKVFCEKLELDQSDRIIPGHPEIMIAYGAALSYDALFSGAENDRKTISLSELIRITGEKSLSSEDQSGRGQLYFENNEEYLAFKKRHPLAVCENVVPEDHNGSLDVYLGIDSGSTTTKFVLLDEKENVIWQFYSRNQGEPLMVAKRALIEMRDAFLEKGCRLNIKASASTGYGELLFNKAFRTEVHTVETVAHAKAAAGYANDVTFILDIGGQDMKGIWLDNGVVTNIVVNEACSSGCGSFLENFADNLQIPVGEIAERSFSSKNPAKLGSRCTVFMNSSIITEQRNGKKPEDIMAGLCRSIIENVFTKVIRVYNLQALGDKIMVQGGTFNNDAVLRAIEQYTGREVIRAPYPGLMGAIGAAMIAKEKYEQNDMVSTFIGLDALEDFSYEQENDKFCPFCGNHCNRSILHFSNGDSWVTNNRCKRGEVIGDLADEEVKKRLREITAESAGTINMFKERQRLLVKDYSYVRIDEKKDIIIGIPMVLAFWDDLPFWRTFWESLGFTVMVSPQSTRKMYENGLKAVTSDTICFPAKLVHGHIRWLEKNGADHIFFPSVTAVETENTEKTSESMCAVVKGYPIVIRNSDDPSSRGRSVLEAPLFHWHSREDRSRQLGQYMEERFGVSRALCDKAIAAGDMAQRQFKNALLKKGAAVIRDAKEKDKYAVVIASRPYQNDFLVNHDIADMFTQMGISVLTADSVPHANEADLSKSRIDVVNNYHARMLSTAVLAASSERLEYVQLVSFGCGHDAYLSDEITRMMKEISGKVPLILKIDESDVKGPLRIRIRSFIETTNRRRSSGQALHVKQLEEPYPQKFTKRDKKERVCLVPNTSHAFARIMSAAMKGQGIRAVPLQIGRENAIRLGKKYVHNDICFPAQIVIGEALEALKSGKYDPDHTAVAMGKYIGDCRLTHYSALLRKALDDAGFPQVPILTNDDVDYHDLHPGFKMNLVSALRLAFTLPMIDALEEILRKMRPYELKKGASDTAFEQAMDLLINGMERGGIPGARKGFARAIDVMRRVRYNRRVRKPSVLIVGEYLLNFHPGANHDIEAYLEDNGFEIIEARMTDVIRKTYFYQSSQIREYKVKQPLNKSLMTCISSDFFDLAHKTTDEIACRHPLYEKAARMQDIVQDSDEIIHHTFDTGEGVLIPAEIIHHAKRGCRSMIILQPFGCLPNHIVGRGIVKKLKEMFPDVQILPLDYDPDVSFANVENRLQMLIMNNRRQNDRN